MIKYNDKIVLNHNDGIKYAKISGDYNKIHLDNLEGYNSIYGEKICHDGFIIKALL